MSATTDTDLYFVLIGRVGRCTIWPCAARLPVDWQVAFGPDTHARCEAYAQQHRSDTTALVAHPR